MQIRQAIADELIALQEIDRLGGRLFAEAGMDEVAAHPPHRIETLQRFQEAGYAWVAEHAGEPAGFALVEQVDGCLHVDQITVHPDRTRRGFGRALLDRVAEQAREQGFPAVTLTTFTEVPFNGPLYERCGFRVLAVAEETAGLRAIRAHEAAIGLDKWPRCCMRRDV